MVHRVDRVLREEVERYKLRFTCPDCASFAPDLRRCSFGYPNELHLDADLSDKEELVFCKAFELL